jgi:hypothetical protein
MKKYENGIFAALFGLGLFVFGNGKMFLVAPLWIGFSICLTFQILDIIAHFKKD